MGYVVQTGVNSMGTIFVDRIPKATSADVADGHLLVRVDTRPIAIYAPGKWQRAFRDAEVTPGAQGEHETFTSEAKKAE